MSDTLQENQPTENNTEVQTSVNTDEKYSKDDLTQAIEKARQQEKDKLYSRLSDIDTKNQEYSQKLTETNEMLKALVAERDEAKRKLEEQAKAEMTAEELVAERLKALEEREARMQAQLEKVAEEAALRVRESELKLFKANVISENNLMLTELVSGNSEEEILASVERAKARENEIFNRAKEQARSELSQNLPKPSTPAPVETQTANIDPTKKFDMANLSSQDFQKLKAELLNRARQQIS
jgi:hypothetical protein